MTLPPPDATPEAGPLLAVYLLIEPLVEGKVVLDVGPSPATGAERLQRAGARDVLRGEALRGAAEEKSVDVVLCLTRLSALPSDLERHRALAEMRRLLKPGGLCVLRLAAASSPDGVAGFEDLLKHHFSSVVMVGERKMQGVSFSVAGVEDVAVNEALSTIAGPPDFFVALCSESRAGVPELPESLLVPTAASSPSHSIASEEVAALRAELGEIGARYRASRLEGDDLREALMVLQDRADRREHELSSLRRQTERHLRRISDQTAAAELAALEREHAHRRASSAERALETLATEVRTLRATSTPHGTPAPPGDPPNPTTSEASRLDP